MGDYTVNIDLPCHKRGDRWCGVESIGPILINGAAPVGDLVRVRMHFRSNIGTLVRLDSDSTAPYISGGIDILDAESWTVRVPGGGGLFDEAGSWEWDLETYEEGEVYPVTVYKGVLEVSPDVTR